VDNLGPQADSCSKLRFRDLAPLCGGGVQAESLAGHADEVDPVLVDTIDGTLDIADEAGFSPLPQHPRQVFFVRTFLLLG